MGLFILFCSLIGLYLLLLWLISLESAFTTDTIMQSKAFAFALHLRHVCSSEASALVEAVCFVSVVVVSHASRAPALVLRSVRVQ